MELILTIECKINKTFENEIHRCEYSFCYILYPNDDYDREYKKQKTKKKLAHTMLKIYSANCVYGTDSTKNEEGNNRLPCLFSVSMSLSLSLLKL